MPDIRKYKARSGATQYKPSLELVMVMNSEDQGFCLACGEIQDGVEPDARKRPCDCCGKSKVYGAAELALMGLVF
jgi:hypothetical protein